MSATFVIPLHAKHQRHPVMLSATKEAGLVFLRIADSGPGVPEEEPAKIFDAFYRADTSRTRETGGTGLGLVIVKTCVESCGGTVSARNRQPHGLEVLVRLPLPRPDGGLNLKPRGLPELSRWCQPPVVNQHASAPAGRCGISPMKSGLDVVVFPPLTGLFADSNPELVVDTTEVAEVGEVGEQAKFQ